MSVTRDLTPIEERFLKLVRHENRDQYASQRLTAKTKLAVSLYDAQKADQRVDQK